MTKKRKGPTLTVDAVLVDDGSVLLIKRQIKPFVGSWVLPGGHVEFGETTEKALEREVREETGLEAQGIKLVGVYSDPDRDPRGHTVSCAYIAYVDKNDEVQLNREADEYGFFDPDDLPEKMGFDHRQIISDAKEMF